MNKAQQYFKKLPISFWFIVALPTLISIVYFGLIASDRYVSTSSFVVRSPQKSTSVSGLSAILQNVGFSRSTDDSYVVNDFVLSRDAVSNLESTLGLRQKYGADRVDLFSRFNPLGLDDSAENLYEYYKKKINIALDSSSSISSLTVRAYTPEDAHNINANLLDQAEALVNKLNERGRQDMLESAQANLQQAEERVKDVSARLTQYRRENQIFDVEKQVTMQMQMISKLQDQLILVKTQLAQVRAVTPENPQLRVLQERERNIRKEIAQETQKALGAGDSINEKTTEYEKLMLERDFAIKQLASTLSTLEQTRTEASKKQLYLERISQPSLPDYPAEPRRLYNIATTLILGLVFWAIFSMLVTGVREHND